MTPADLDVVLEARDLDWKRARELALLSGWAAEWCARKKMLSATPSESFEHLMPRKQEPTLAPTAIEFRQMLIELTEAMGGEVHLS